MTACVRRHPAVQVLPAACVPTLVVQPTVLASLRSLWVNNCLQLPWVLLAEMCSLHVLTLLIGQGGVFG